jgi:hypothetical protein
MLTKLLVKAILQKATDYKWSIQGLGMLRLYLSDDLRLHVWDDRYRVKNVSVLHTHPWAFDSVVVAGRIHQYRYEEVKLGEGLGYWVTTIKCGEGGGVTGEKEPVNLKRGPLETFHEGSAYRQWAHEIHESFPENGTVTLVTRHFQQDKDHARVFWPSGEWVSAEPRTATRTEIMAIASNALERWFS